MSDTSSDTSMDDAYTIGAILRGAREANGETIEDVARMLRINWRYLQALEDGQFHQLPGTVYAIGFIRTYADHLGIDSADLIDRFKAVSSSSPTKPSLEFPEPIPESGLPGGAILFAGIVVAILAYGGWYLATEEDNFLARMVSPVPEHLAEEEQTTASVETVPQPVAVEKTEEAQHEAEEQAPEQDVAVEQPDEPIEPEEPIVEASEDSTQTVDEQSTVVEAVEEAVMETVVEDSTEVTEEVADAVQTEEEMTEQAASETATETEAIVEQVAVVAVAEEEIVSESVADSVDATQEDDLVAEVSDPVNSEVEPESLSEAVADNEEEADSLSLNEAQLQAVQETLSGEVADEPGVETVTEADSVSESEVTEEDVDEAVEDFAASADEALETTTTEETAIEDAGQQGTDAALGVSSDSEDTQVAAIPAEEPVSETASGRVYGDQENARIVVRAKANSWIQVRNDSSGQLLLTRLLRAGDEYHVPDQGGLSLLTGNAGALEILVDGSAVPAIGSSGDVRRNVALDAERLKSGDAAN